MKRLILLAAIGLVGSWGCKKKSVDTLADTAPPPAPAANSNSGGSGGSGGGGGAAMAVLKATRRAQAMNELKNLGEIIEALRDPFGKMPTEPQIRADLQKSAPHILKGIDEGAYILTGTPDGGGLWAYEVDADKHDGIAVIGGRATRSTTEEVNSYLKKK